MRIFLLAGLAFGLSAAAAGASAAHTDPVIAGYVFPQNTTLQAGQVDAHAMTRIYYAFAKIQDGRLVEGFPSDPANLAMLTDLRRQNPALTVLISVGGWLWSGGFSDVALTHQSRKDFV